jgi:hypothetical protein
MVETLIKLLMLNENKLKGNVLAFNIFPEEIS